MGKHTQLKQLLALSDRTAVSGSLRQTQRRLEAQLRIQRVSLLLILGLLLLLALLAVKPSDFAIISSPASNLIPGGVPSRISQGPQAIQDSLVNADVSRIFRYFYIDEISIRDLKKTTINPSRSDLYAVTTRATGRISETKHTFEGHTFYDAPLSELLVRTDEPITVFTGRTSQKTDESSTGMRGRWFAILPESGSIIFEKQTDAQANARVFAEQPTLQPNGTAQFFAEVQLTTGAVAKNGTFKLSLPNTVQLTSLTQGRDMRIVSKNENSATISYSKPIGGNKSLWVPFTITANEQDALNESICPEVQFIASTQSSVFSDTQCVDIVESSNEISSQCIRQRDGSYRMRGDFISIADSACLSRFENAHYSTSNLVSNDGLVELRLVEKNLGSNDVVSHGRVNVADILEYAALGTTSKGELNNSNIEWRQEVIQPNSESYFEAVFSQKRPLPSQPTARTDTQSYDTTLQVAFGDSFDALRLTPPMSKRLETISNRTPIINRAGTFVAFSLIAVFMTIHYAHTKSVLDNAKRKRSLVNGGATS